MKEIGSLAKPEETERALNRALQLGGTHADEEPMIISAMLHASLGQRDRIDPRVFHFKPEETVDGDTAEDWFLTRVVGRETAGPRLGSGALCKSVITITHGFSAIKTETGSAPTPNFKASCRNPATLESIHQIIRRLKSLTL